MSSTNNLFAGLNQSQAAPVNGPETQQLAGQSPSDTPVPETGSEDEGDAPQLTELDMLKNRARLMGIVFSNNIKVETLRAKIQTKLDSESGDNAQDDDAEDGEDEINEGDAGDEPAEQTKAEVPAPVPAPAPAPVPAASGSGGSLLAQIATMSAEEKAAMLALLGGSAPAAPAARVTGGASKVARDQALRDEIIAEQTALVRCRIQNMDPKKANLPGEIFTVANEYLGTIRKYVPYGEVTDDGYHLPRCIYNQLIERTFVLIKTVKNKNGRGTVTTTSDAREFSIEVLPPLTQDDLAKLASAQAAAAGN